jgi:hypothetical protein
MGTYSVKALETGYNNMGLVNLMHASQKCFLSQAAKSDF